MLAIHERYGPVVRIAPDELAFADASAWKDIMGHQPKGDEVGKWVKFYRPVDGVKVDITSADREEHGRLRRLLAHGFSDRSMREQEPLIGGYVDLLMRRLREHCRDGTQALDMAAWYNFTTFDVIGDLALGESFGCLERSDWHPWVRNIFTTVQMGTYLQSAAHFPTLAKLLVMMIPESFKKGFQKHRELTRLRVQKRMQWGKVRHDLIEGLLTKQDEWQMPLSMIEAHAGLLIIAGSETTATFLSGVTYLLLQNPEALAKLTHEVRSTFTSEGEITINTASRLTYILACLDEALRCYPPVPGGLPRVVPAGGKTLCGHFVPEGVSIYLLPVLSM